MNGPQGERVWVLAGPAGVVSRALRSVVGGAQMGGCSDVGVLRGANRAI